MTSRDEVIKRVEALEEKAKRVRELERELQEEKNRAENLMRWKTSYEALGTLLREVVGGKEFFDELMKKAEQVKASGGNGEKVDLTVPKYEVTVATEKIAFNFKKDDPKSQVLYGIYITKGSKRLTYIKENMINEGYKRAADGIEGLMQELVADGLVIEFNQDKTHLGYKLTPGISWTFPDAAKAEEE